MKNFNTDKVIVALGLHGQDDCLLDYVEFLNRQFDFKEITALHVLPKSTPVLEAETAQTVTGYRAQYDYEEQLEESIEEYISSLKRHYLLYHKALNQKFEKFLYQLISQNLLLRP